MINPIQYEHSIKPKKFLKNFEKKREEYLEEDLITSTESKGHVLARSCPDNGVDEEVGSIAI